MTKTAMRNIKDNTTSPMLQYVAMQGLFATPILVETDAKAAKKKFGEVYARKNNKLCIKK